MFTVSLPPSSAGELEGVLAQGGHTTEVALLRALGPLASSASEAQAQWLLQRTQLMLATMHQRAACGERSALRFLLWVADIGNSEV